MLSLLAQRFHVSHFARAQPAEGLQRFFLRRLYFRAADKLTPHQMVRLGGLTKLIFPKNTLDHFIATILHLYLISKAVHVRPVFAFTGELVDSLHFAGARVDRVSLRIALSRWGVDSFLLFEVLAVAVHRRLRCNQSRAGRSILDRLPIARPLGG